MAFRRRYRSRFRSRFGRRRYGGYRSFARRRRPMRRRYYISGMRF